MKKFLSIVLVMLLLLVQIPVAVVQAAEPAAEYETKLSAARGSRGTEVTVEVNLKFQAETQVNGIELTVEFDDRFFDYITGSAKAGISPLADATIHYNGDGKIGFVWTSKESVTLEKETRLFVATLVVSEFSPAASTQISAHIDRIYRSAVVDGDIQMQAIDCTTNSIPLFTVDSADEEVKSVMALIGAIGAITYDSATLERITKAGSAYHKLTAVQKEQVSNYNVLVAAEERYRQLQAGGVLPADVKAQIDGFMTEHAEALSLTVEKISASEDPVALNDMITAALEDYANLTSPHAQAELVAEKTTLKQFQELIKEKAQDLLDQQQEEKYQAEARAKAAQFRESFAYALSLTVETVRTFDKTNVQAAWNSYQATSDIRGVGVYFAAEVEAEAALLEALVAQITKLEMEENPEIAQEILNAEKYKEQFAGILILTPEELVYEDVLDVRLAYMMLEMMDEKTLALLTEQQEIMEALYEAALKLEPEKEEPIIPVPPEQVKADQFKEAFADVLVLTPNIISYNDVLDIKLAKAMLDRLDANTLALLASEQAAVKVLYTKALALEKDKENEKPEVKPETLSAEQWITRFTPVLNLTVDNLTADDVLDVKLAKLALELLSEDARKLLEDEQKTVQALYDKAITIEPEKEIITQVIEKLVEKNVRVEVVERKPSITIWVLLGIAVLAVALYAIVNICYRGKFLKGGK